ncbi:hypothetical protein [Segetibacter sp.]|jgi:hypothetical protein|uniref:hypothetical protein n=1 Tax=Segetibacter sp. TaxID=2231182 RepID=UPI00261128C9|nr:hypothetical protein [Segetibacter sp.]MCW3081631.1 hypothetical protein [Segetibacter sp.]
MTVDDFKKLEDRLKVQMIFDAKKISEKIDHESNYQLFQIGNFFVEAKTSLEGKFKRSIKTYTLRELPVDYAGEVLGMPIVKFANDIAGCTDSSINFKKKEKST